MCDAGYPDVAPDGGAFYVCTDCGGYDDRCCGGNRCNRPDAVCLNVWATGQNTCWKNCGYSTFDNCAICGRSGQQACWRPNGPGWLLACRPGCTNNGANGCTGTCQ